MDNKSDLPPGAIGGDADGDGFVDLSAVKPRIPGVNKDGTPRKKRNSNPEKSAPSGPPLSDADAAFIAESAVLLLESGDEIIAKTLRQKLAKAVPEREADFLALQQSVGLNDRDKAMLRASVTAIVKKYGILGRFGPEILLLVFAAQYAYRQVKLSRFVDEIIALKKKETAGQGPPKG